MVRRRSRNARHVVRREASLLFGVVQPPRRHLQHVIGPWRDADSRRIGVERPEIEVRAVLIRLAAIERRGLGAPSRAAYASRDHATGDMRRVQPVMADGGNRIRECRYAMREGHRTERGLADRTAVDNAPEAATNRPLVLDRQFHEQVARVLPIVNGVTVAKLARRQQVWVAAAADRPWLEAQHRPYADAATPDRAPRHSHGPIDAAGLVRTVMLLTGLVDVLQ